MSDPVGEFKARKHARALQTCKHFNGLVGPGMVERPCKAGVDYASVRTETPPELRGPDVANVAWPCLPPFAGQHYPVAVECPKREYPTIEEVEADDRAMQAAIDLALESVRTGKCGTCGAVMLRRGTAFACPNGHTSGFACGPRDIDETGRRRGRAS